MRWSHTFRVEAPIETVYQRVLAPDRFFSFYPGYRGLISVDGDWPAEGGTLVVRYSVLPGLSIRLHQTVTRHVTGEYLEIDEEALGGLWRDRPRFRFSSNGDDGTDITLTVEPSSGVKALRPLLWLITLAFIPIGRQAMRRLKEMSETEPEPERPSSGPAGPVG